MSRNHPGYREYATLELKEPMGEMFINQSSMRIRRNSASAADLHETSVDFSMSDLHPVASSGRARSPGPLPSTSNQCVAPREQFDRDYPLKPRHPTAKYSLDRPLSMTVMDEHPHMLRKERPNQFKGPHQLLGDLTIFALEADHPDTPTEEATTLLQWPYPTSLTIVAIRTPTGTAGLAADIAARVIGTAVIDPWNRKHLM
ncbi:uncharacterized protein N7518_001320 [Penicillium psychrosexuale]|uniref:uncharacterized protein n=1 Tax=Penicillium psychrosexuale TaxID=1002107 RepID=UPI002544F3D1|nr:uncharacterized protein N7518_001320 [Penicillium psychrosexuale]KAJ5799252.1 hypothetical protein N7518_001320 [Penicillium psychrosexuale]